MSSHLTACKLDSRGVLHLSGEDRFAFLQGLISNDMALCLPDSPLFAALLTPQGKFLHDLFIYDRGDAYLIDCERPGELLAKLKSYKLRAKVVMEDVSDGYEVIAIALLPLAGGVRGGWGVSFPSESSSFLTEASVQNSKPDRLTLPPRPPLTPPASGRGTLALDPRLPALGLRGILGKGEEPDGVAISDTSAYDHHRITLGIPDGSRDMIVGKSTLSDGNFDVLNGISWKKGCYIGQELTARMHHRALVKKRLFPVKITGTAPPREAIVFLNGAEVGEMRSSESDVGLALLNIESAKQAIGENLTLDCEGAKLVPYVPEWLRV